MKRKILLLALLQALIVAGTKAQTTVTIDYLNYSFGGDTAIVTGFTTIPADSIVNIPETVNYEGKTYSVTAVGNSAFARTPGYKHVSMPSVKYIGKRAFERWGVDSYLKTVYMPNIITIGDSAFCSTPLTTFGEVPHLISVGNQAFMWTKLLEVNMPNVKRIGNASFHNIMTLLTVNLPNVLQIGGGAFQNCEYLQSANIPKVTEIGNIAFYICSRLTTVNMQNVDSIGPRAFLLSGIESAYMPNVRTIEDWAFQRTPLRYAYMPKVEKIAQYAFADDGMRGIHIWEGGPLAPRSLEYVTMPISCKLEIGAFYQTERQTVFFLLDADSVYEAHSYCFPSLARLISPVGKAALLINKWNLIEAEDRSWQQIPEVYSPIVMRKTNDKYNTLTIEINKADASITYNDTIYENNYDFNYALSKSDVETVMTYDETFGGSNYQYKWFAATSYSDNTALDGTLTITPPSTESDRKGIGPGEGFMLQGPVVTGEGDDIIYVPVHCSLAKYEDTNYFKAGTGGAVPRESDGCYNFYFSASKQAFYRCNNTVIPTNMAYLALPTSMTNNAKQIAFVIDDGTTTGIVNLNDDRYTMDDDGNLVPIDGVDNWYTLSGVRLDSKPAVKGIYIHKGRKEVIR